MSVSDRRLPPFAKSDSPANDLIMLAATLVTNALLPIAWLLRKAAYLLLLLAAFFGIFGVPQFPVMLAVELAVACWALSFAHGVLEDFVDRHWERYG